MSNNARVLLVDDDEDLVEVLAELLAASGYIVCGARSASEALEAAREFKPIVAIIDIFMPGEDGFRLLQRLKRIRECSSTHFIAYSGYTRREDIEKSLRGGFEMHINKPAPLTQMLAAIERAIHGRLSSL